MRTAPMLRGPLNLPFLGQAYDFWRDPVGLLHRGQRTHGERFRFVLAGKQVTVGLGPEFHRAFFAAGGDLLSPVSPEVVTPHIDIDVQAYVRRWGNQGEVDLFDLPALAAWAGILLHQHPRYLSAIVAEIDVGDTFALERAVLEAERLRPPVDLLKRTALRDCELAGTQVDAGSTVIVSPAVAHRLPSLFSDPDRYDPDRFAAGEPVEALIRFGGGPRVVELWARILRDFEIDLLERDFRKSARIRYRRRTPVFNGHHMVKA